MTGFVTSFTIIHIGSQGPESSPYAVVLAEGDDGASVAGRADGDLSWLAIGTPVDIVDDFAGAPAQCRPR